MRVIDRRVQGRNMKVEGLHCCRFACTFDAQIYMYMYCCLTIIGWHFACFAILNACDNSI